MITVYHNKKFTDYTFRKNVGSIPKRLLRKVATVDTDSLEEAFRLTNNIDHSWTKNKEVTAIEPKLRSSSVGDVFEKGDKIFMIASCGFNEIKVEGLIG